MFCFVIKIQEMKNLIYWTIIFLFDIVCQYETDQQTDQDIKEVDTTLMMQFDGNDDEESDTSDTGLSLQVSGGFERDVEDYNKQRGTAEFHFKRGLVLLVLIIMQRVLKSLILQ